MNRVLTILIVLSSLLFWGIACKAPKDTLVKPSSTLVKYNNVEVLLSKMTLEEKIGQMNQYSGFFDLTGPAPSEGDAATKYKNLAKGFVGSMLNVRGVENIRKIQKIAVEQSRLGIPLIFGSDVIHGYKTLAPIPLAESSSWDMEAIKHSASMAAKEAAASGLNWTFAPMIDISRDARWGRVMEGAGEDTYLGSKIAVARIQGFQGNDLSDPLTIAACAKHFAGYGFAESGREYNTVDISGHTLHNVVLPPFKAAVEAGVATFMNGFNDLNGIPATANKYLQRDLLKRKWGFEGFVVSDWGSVAEIAVHGHANSPEEATQIAANAGSDMDMESYFYVKYLANQVQSGAVSEAKITEAARRILNVKQALGLLDDPYKYCDIEREKEVVSSDAQRDAALNMAKKSIVLLKNEGKLLPLKKNKKVAVIGPHVADKNSPLGSWRIGSDDNTAVSLQEGLSKYTTIDFSFYQGVALLKKPAEFVFETDINEDDRTGIDQAVQAAKNADIVIMALGEHGFQSGEARSRTNISLPGLQQELLEAVFEVNQNVVLILFNGRPLAIPWAAEHVPTIVEAWQLGTESGNAIAQVVMGDYNPSGKLTVSFPRNVGQVPLYYNAKSTGRPSIRPNKDLVFWSHYSDSPNSPQFAFGHGESYTTFDYSGFTTKVYPNGNIQASVNVANIGNYDGEEVVQLYIHDVSASLTRPELELKGFEKLMLKQGQSKKISFLLTEDQLGFFDNNGNYLFEAGEFDIMVGGASDKLLKRRVDNTIKTLKTK